LGQSSAVARVSHERAKHRAIAFSEENSGRITKEKTMAKAKTGGVETTKLKSYIERIEKLEEEKAAIAADVRDVFAEAKANGFDTKTMRQIVKLRKLNHNDRMEQEYMLDLYKRALGLEAEYDEAA
jgi:uncharacterized protein (UPF0335 family)